MARDFKFMASDVQKHASEVNKVVKDIPRIMAGAAIKMKDANFAAQGFIENGTVSRWPKRKNETRRTKGKKVLHGTGMLQDSVKKRVSTTQVSLGVDLAKVPYAQIHNEGGKAGRNQSADIPERKYLGYTPDIDKITEREVTARLDNIFNG